jgi:hypothetical protein
MVCNCVNECALCTTARIHSTILFHRKNLDAFLIHRQVVNLFMIQDHDAFCRVIHCYVVLDCTQCELCQRN